MKDLDWKILSVLYVTKNITKTAKLLFTGQPNITKRIKGIENELGFPIIFRTPTGIRFTSRGEVLAKRAIEIDQMIAKAMDELHEISGQQQKVIRIVGPNSFVRTDFPDILEQFSKAYPYISFQLYTCLSDEIPKFLKRRDIDVCFSHVDVEDAPFKLLYDTRSMIIASQGPIEIDMLPDLPQVDYTRSLFTREKINTWWSDRFDRPQKIILTVNGIDTCQEIVSRGVGYGLFFGTADLRGSPKLYKQLALNRSGVPTTRDTWMACSKSGYSRRSVREFADFIQNVYIPAYQETPSSDL